MICNNMVTSTRAIVNTARSMVSTIMKFLDSGPGKSADGNLKARVMTSEPDNAEGLHNFAPLGAFSYLSLLHPMGQYFYSYRTDNLTSTLSSSFFEITYLFLHRHHHIQQPHSAASRSPTSSHASPPPRPLSSLVLHLPAGRGLV